MRPIQAIRLRDLRRKQKLSQLDLALKLNVSNQVISNWERNYSTPDLESITTLSNIFDVDSDYLLGISDIEKKNLPPKVESPEVKELIDMYNELSSEGKTWLLQTIKLIKSGN